MEIIATARPFWKKGEKLVIALSVETGRYEAVVRRGLIRLVYPKRKFLCGRNLATDYYEQEPQLIHHPHATATATLRTASFF